MFEAWNTLGAIHQAAGDLDAAEQAYGEALVRFPGHPEALTNLATIDARRGRYDRAAESCGKALAADPTYAEAHLTMGIVRREQERFDEAAAAFAAALRIDPAAPAAHVKLGTVLAASGRTEAALACYEDALALDPDLAEAHLNKGNALRDLGRLEDGIGSYRRALDLQPGSVDAHFNLGLALLAAGDFATGWPEHEWRWQTEKLGPYARRFDEPLWDGSPLDGRTLLVWTEQGIGDEIMFTLCLGDLLRREAGVRVLLECDSRLGGLFERTYPGLTVLDRDRFDPRGDGVARPQFGCHIPAGSLPQHFRSSADDFPAAIEPLRPDPVKCAFWRQRLEALGDGLKVGIAWRGGVLQQMKRQKSVPLDAFGPILAVPGIDFVNLQYGDCADDLAAAKGAFGVEVHDWPEMEPTDDIEGQAALIANLDLVVQTSNASAHLAGALGIPVWTLVSAAPDWRWGATGSACLWYPSMRLFRQRRSDDWAGLVDEVATALRSLVGADGR